MNSLPSQNQQLKDLEALVAKKNKQIASFKKDPNLNQSSHRSSATKQLQTTSSFSSNLLSSKDGNTSKTKNTAALFQKRSTNVMANQNTEEFVEVNLAHKKVPAPIPQYQGDSYLRAPHARSTLQSEPKNPNLRSHESKENVGFEYEQQSNQYPTGLRSFRHNTNQNCVRGNESSGRVDGYEFCVSSAAQS